MATSNLAQHVADTLFAMEKHRVGENMISFVDLGQSENLELMSPDESERFLLDLSRGRLSLSQVKLQNRARNSVVLARLELNGPRHRNPDGNFIASPHLHLYREGFGDSWAFPVPPQWFSDLGNELATFREFMSFCNITMPPNIKLQGGLSL